MRTRNPIVVLGADGKPLAGAKVETKTRPAGALATVYANETGEEAGSNPAITDAKGRVVQWLERGAYSSLCTAEGMEAYSEAWDSAPAKDAAIDENWLAVVLKTAITEAPSYGSGTHAARPAAAAGPDFYFETDTGILCWNNGSWWAAGVGAPGDLVWSAAASLEGHVKCDGQALARVGTYAHLYAAIGVSYGEGDKATTFNAPDYREKMPIGVGGGYSRGSKGGEATHALTIAELASHGHTLNDPGHVHAISDPGHGHSVSDGGHSHSVREGGFLFRQTNPGAGGYGLAVTASDPYIAGGDGIGGLYSNTGTGTNGSGTGIGINSGSTGIGVNNHTTGMSLNNSGSGTAHNNLPPYLSSNVFIRY